MAEQVAEEADSQRHSSGAVVQRISRIEEARQRGEIDEKTAEELEGKVIEEHTGRPAAGPEDEEVNQDG